MSPLALVTTIVLTTVTLLVLLEGSLTFLGSTVFTVNERGAPSTREGKMLANSNLVEVPVLAIIGTARG